MPEAGIKDPMPEYAEQLNNDDAAQLAKEERELVRKIDIFLLPTIWLMYLLSYMDRTKYAAV